MKQNDNLVLIGTYANAADAYIAKGVLETNDIPAVVNDANISTIYGGLLPDLDARLYVRATDYDKAKILLSSDSNCDNTQYLQPTQREKTVVKISQIVIGVIVAVLIFIFLFSRSVV
ncbi:MAG: DUF2007 domain-containing protein [Muribaculum sp.]|nr:DUF2007 domain-containing protein [Muribaculum sp.]